MQNTISSELLARMFLAGARNLESKKEWINELNVFPVPDGDTGTNMCMTIQSAANEVKAVEVPNMESICKAISSGSLRGARGNSGVILSQLFRGFTKVVKTYDELDTIIISEACQKAVESAYKAVMKPKEGTILTVAKGIADKALELAANTDNMGEFIDEIVREAERVLDKTPDLLPVLKQAGVVDSGGQGLVEILKGAQDAFYGREPQYDDETVEQEPQNLYDYETSFVLLIERPLSEKEATNYKDYLNSIGDSVLVITDDLKIKTELKTNDPGLALQQAINFGSVKNVSITNLKLDEKKAKEETKAVASQEPQKPAEPAKEMGFVSVSIGAGLGEIFTELGVDCLIEGGQTMNPSTEDVLNAIYKVNAKTVFVLPNNKNIILAANQAASIAENVNVVVIPTKTIPQGITALVNYIPDSSVEENTERMTESLSTVKTGQVTYAVRDTEIDDKVIHEGDYMGIADAGILSVDKKMESCFMDLIDQLVDEDSAIISIYYGEEIKEKDAEKLAAKIEKQYPDLEVELQNGGQPVYYYVCSVE